MKRVTAVVSAALCLTLAGCAQAGNDQRARGTTTSGPIQAECADLETKAGALAVVANGLSTGEATVNQVRSAGADLIDSFADAAEKAGPDLARTGDALQRVEDALTAQPVDTKALREATNEVRTTLTTDPPPCTP
ncbi:hypothetical protein [Actinophytocola sp.]|uniref:hypothetical protein n=1 Tax=Actinophytocola sp. TaxID=1872138 RepID=UPI002ED674A2